MALNPMYITTSDITNYAVDKDTGMPLSNGVITFFQDNARNMPKAVFELTGPPYSYNSLGAVVTLSNVGTTQDATGNNQVIYYYPYDSSGNIQLYYVVISDQNGVVQATRSAWPNNINASGSGGSTAIAPPANNQLSNPQFLNSFLNPGITTPLSVTGALNQSFPICPDWNLVLTGTGTVTVQIAPLQGGFNVPTSPPYILDVSVGGGISACYLSQTIPYNSGLWASSAGNSIFLSGSFLAQNQNSGSTSISMFYAESSGTLSTSPVQIFSGFFTSAYSIVQGGTAAAIPVSSDINSGENGFVQIYLSFPSNSHTRVTSVELIPSFTAYASTAPIPYDLNSSNKNEAFQGDYYIPNLNAKQIASFLVGWDFALNPFQLGNSGILLAPNTFAYIADQTILGRPAISGGYAWSNAANSLQISLPGNGGAFYIQQYLTGDIVQKIIANSLSVNVNAWQSTGGSSPVTMQIYLFGAPAVSTSTTLPLPLVLVATDGTVTLTTAAVTAGWTAIPRSGLSIPNVQISMATNPSQIINGNNDYGFSQWQVTNVTQLLTMVNFAIVVSFSGNNGASSAANINIASVSMVPGNIPSRPGVQSVDEVQRQCEYYFQQSFPPGVKASDASGIGGPTYSVQSQGANQNCIGPIISFPVSMRSTPSITLFNPAIGGTSGQIKDITVGTNWTSSIIPPTNISQNGFTTSGTTPTGGGGSAIGDLTAVHWTADCRLGLFP